MPELKKMTYKLCKLPTLHYRRIRGDTIEIYKIVLGKYKVWQLRCYLDQTHNVTRLQKSRAKYDLRKFIFTNRVVNIWNSLLGCVVRRPAGTTAENIFIWWPPDNMWWPPDSDVVATTSLSGGHILSGGHQIKNIFCSCSSGVP